MPLSKATKDAHRAAGLCTLCKNPAAPVLNNKGEPVIDPFTRKPAVRRFCEYHLKYWRRYRKVYAKENPEPKKKKCSACRRVGHTFEECESSEAAALRAIKKPN